MIGKCPECHKRHRKYPWHCFSIANNRFSFDVICKLAGGNDIETEAYLENKEKLVEMERYVQTVFNKKDERD